MASFMENLWASIFTPGPTPTLLRAANASFGALQVVLFVLLVATYSIHFVILSLLSGALWYSINWFAAELQIAKAQQEEERARNAAQETEDIDSAPANDSEDTEVETGATGRAAKRAIKERKTAGSASREVEVVEDAAGELKKRVNAVATLGEPEKGKALGSPQGGTQSSVSTEDEWEKVSENENEKDK